MLAAAWGIALQFGEGPPTPPPPPVIRHESVQPKNIEPAVAPSSTSETKADDSPGAINLEQSETSSSTTDNNAAPLKE